MTVVELEHGHYRDEDNRLRCSEEYEDVAESIHYGRPISCIRCPHFLDPMRFEPVEVE